VVGPGSEQVKSARDSCKRLVDEGLVDATPSRLEPGVITIFAKDKWGNNLPIQVIIDY